jgi:hypothetical protein
MKSVMAVQRSFSLKAYFLRGASTSGRRCLTGDTRSMNLKDMLKGVLFIDYTASDYTSTN